MSSVDVAAIKAEHAEYVDRHGDSECSLTGNTWPCQTYRLADALERAQVASEGVDMLVAQAEARGLADGWAAGFKAGSETVAQAERRGAVRALRTGAEVFRQDGMGDSELEAVYCDQRVVEIENGADL